MKRRRQRERCERWIQLLVLLVLAMFQPLALAAQMSVPNSASPLPTSLLSNTTTLPEINNATLTNDTAKRRKRISKAKQNENRPAKQTTKRETGTQEAASLRRIKREWRDAVKLGIAYDWMSMKTLGTSCTTKYSYVRIGPLGKNLLKWHFSVSGPPNSPFEGGIYHGRVLLPKNYPASPPRIQVLTPSGRFIVGHDICLSASSFHPETWTPRWTILSLVEALRLHMLTTANEIGGKEDSPQKRRQYAQASRIWKLGRIDHATMIQQGIFPYHQEENVGEEMRDTEKSAIAVDSDGGSVHAVAAVSKHQTHRREAPIRKRVPQNATLPVIFFRAVVQVLTSPVRLGILFLLTVFAFLNRR